jgi:exosortase
MYKPQKHLLVFIFLWIVSLLVGWHFLVATVTLSFHDDEYSQLLLILPISAALIFLERPIAHWRGDWSFRVAPVLIASAAAIAISIGFCSASLPADLKLSLGMLALVISWIGIFILCFGLSLSRSVLFPLLFLFGLVPLPRNVLNLIISMLQDGSAWSAHALFAACGVPVFQQGVLITIPNLTIEVAKECSSIRSSSMLLVTTLVLTHLLLRSPWRKALVIGLAIPLSIAKNGLRIFTIAMLGTHVDPGYLTGRLHRQGGIVFFAVALAGVFALIWMFRRGEGVVPAMTSQ